MKIRTLAIGAAALLLPFGAVACGGSDDSNSGSRPSASEISKAFTDQAGVTLPGGVADCFGKGLEESDLPNGVLRAFVAGDEPQVDADNKDKYEDIVAEVSTDCAGQAATTGASS